MTAFRILDQSPVFFDLQGRLAAGGRLEFYAAGTTTPKSVFGDQALSVNNGSSIAIGSDGRPVDDIWGDGNYRVRVYAADGTLIADDDGVEVPGGSAASIPPLQSGKVLSNDGAVLQWLALLQPPDPTGQGGKVLGSDGASIIWVDKPQDGAAGAGAAITLLASGVKIGADAGDLFIIQTGSDTAPASGTNAVQKSVAFPIPFKTLMHVSPVITGTAYNNVGFYASPAVSAKSVTGFTFAAQVSAHQGGSGSDANISSSVPFDWIAYGTVARS